MCLSTQKFTHSLSTVSSQRRATRSDVSFQTKQSECLVTDELTPHTYIPLRETLFCTSCLLCTGVKIAFLIAHTRNDVAVLFGTLKVQSFMLTEVRDCDLLIVVTSSTFLKRKDMLKEKSSWPRSSKPPAQHIYRQMYFVHLYGLHVYCALVDLGSSGSPEVSVPHLGSHQVPKKFVYVYARIQAHTHTPP